MMRRSLMGAMAALCLVVAAPAAADSRYGGADHSVRLRLGLYTPDGDGEYFAGKEEDFTGDAADFEDAVGGVDYLYHAGSRFRFVLSGDAFEGQTDAEYRDFVDNRGDAIVHTTTLEITSITAGVQIPLAPEGAFVQPYVGAGGGLYNYRLEESGDFIDFGRAGRPIFSTTLEAEGDVLGYYLLAGLELPIGNYFSFFAEGRWDNAEDELEGDFDDPEFGTLDLSGRRIMGGVSWSF